MSFATYQPRRPEMFKHIADNDAQREVLRDKFAAGDGTQKDWRQLKALVEDRRNLRRGAELAMRWNTDKGNTG